MTSVAEVAAPDHELRRVARRLATGVTIVATEAAGGVHAMTANSFVTLSLEPPLIGVAVKRTGRFRALLSVSSTFGVSILGRTQVAYARHFACPDREDGADAPPLRSEGAPVVPGAIGHFICDVDSIQPVGDHDLVVGRVVGCEQNRTREDPLIFLDGAFCR